MKRIHITLIAAVVIIAAACNTGKQATANTANNSTVQQALDSGKWKFTANQVMPQYGEYRQANGDYDARFFKDSMIVYLPYIGKADAGASFMTGKGPLDFTSTSFSIQKTKNKKGLWQISVIPKDNREVRMMSFTISPGGFASLNITMANRTGISYTGTVTTLP